MANYIEPIARLINEFSKLPGVGNKTAQRYALNVLKMSNEQARQFAEAIVDAKEQVKFCSVCGNFTDSDPCTYCRTKNPAQICVVQEPKDVLAIERIGEYKGVYHVLHGVLNPMQGVGVNDIRLKELVQRLNGQVKEVIVATDATVEGEATAMYIAKLCKPLEIKVTRLAQGISIGSELQYADEVTLSMALRNRREL
ncbi:MAG: recombination protein RecR [Clostridia bacterium]|nr:recombination protein RecR [Clostridia bacterium]